MKRFIFSAAAILFTIYARANDTFAEIAGGNVNFEKTHDISMESEVLEISLDEIKVDYIFKNLSQKMIETDISFPLEEMHVQNPYSVNVTDFLKDQDPLHFHLQVDGQDKPVKIVTVMAGTPAEQEEDVVPFSVNYVWKQKFNPGQTIRVTHTYKPAVGSGGGDEINEETQKTYCTDKSFDQGFKKLKARIRKVAPKADLTKQNGGLSAYMHYHSYGHVSYVLKTGNNWAGPIKKFQLKLKKKTAGTLVSLCWDGLKKVSDTEFVSDKTSFSPDRDLKILFVAEDIFYGKKTY